MINQLIDRKNNLLNMSKFIEALIYQKKIESPYTKSAFYALYYHIARKNFNLSLSYLAFGE